jgi:hypothetical protein
MDWRSKKLLVAVAAFFYVIAASVAGINSDLIKLTMIPIIAYLGAQGVADIGKGAKLAESTEIKRLTELLHRRLDSVEQIVQLAVTGANRFKP